MPRPPVRHASPKGRAHICPSHGNDWRPSHSRAATHSRAASFAGARGSSICDHSRHRPSRETRHYREGDGDAEPEYLERVAAAAEDMRATVRAYVAAHGARAEDGAARDDDARGGTPRPPPIKLVGILSHDGDARGMYGNETYSEQIAHSCRADGIAYELWRVPSSVEALERAIRHANERLDVHGILVFHPVFDVSIHSAETTGKTYKCRSTGVYYRSMDDYFRDLVAPHKDVEGYSRKRLRIQTPETNGSSIAVGDGYEETTATSNDLGPVYPCTALAVFKIIEAFHARNTSASTGSAVGNAKQFENAVMTVINRSEVLGLPLAHMLANQGATVYSVDADSVLRFLPDGKVRRERAATTVARCLRASSVVVSGVPSPAFRVPPAWRAGATLINVAPESNFDAGAVRDGARGVTYVSHVGRVTVAALEYNLMCLHKNYHLK